MPLTTPKETSKRLTWRSSVKVGDLVKVENSDILGLIVSPVRKRYMVGHAALVFWNGELKYILENRLTLAQEKEIKTNEGG